MGNMDFEKLSSETPLRLSDSLSARPASPTYVPDAFITAQASWVQAIRHSTDVGSVILPFHRCALKIYFHCMVYPEGGKPSQGRFVVSRADRIYREGGSPFQGRFDLS